MTFVMDWGHLLGRIHAPGLKSKGVSIDVCSMIDRYLSLDGALGAELQQAMTPAEAVELLKDGLRRSTSGETSTRNRTALLSDAAGGQYPYAAVLSCIDSRAPVEQIFDAASGDLFVARVAGNVASPDLTASLEYATKYAGSKAILVLGHTRCGAVKGAWAGLEDGHLTGLLGRIQPAVDETKSEVGAEDSAENLDRCSQVNVRKTMAALRSDSSILAGLEAEGKIAIVGGVYDVATGEVAWLD